MQKEPVVHKKLPLYVSLLWIVGSVVLISGSVFTLQRFQQKRYMQKLKDPKYAITTIVQTGPQKEALKTSYLAELMNLSVDNPTNIFRFDVKKTEQLVQRCPLIQSVQIKTIKPNTVYIDYTIRQPIAHVLDYENIGIDKEGYLFPLKPFYSVSELPEIFLGLAPFAEETLDQEAGYWQIPLSSKKTFLALEFLQLISQGEFPFRVKRIDVSSSYLPSFGRREIVLMIEEELALSSPKGTCYCVFPKTLRLSPKNYEKQLGNFLVLREKMLGDYQKQMQTMEIVSKKMEFAPQVIDFRIDELAFIQTQGEKG